MKILYIAIVICVFLMRPSLCVAAGKVTGEVVISATQVLKSEIERIDLTPGTPEHALAVAAGLSVEELQKYQAIYYRINLITNGISQTIQQEKEFGVYAPNSIAPGFRLNDAWLEGALCILLIQDSTIVEAKVLGRQADGSWTVSDTKELKVGIYSSCFIRKTAPQTIVQDEYVNGTLTKIDRFQLSGTTLVAVP